MNKIIAKFDVKTPIGKFSGTIPFECDDECCKALEGYLSGKTGMMLESGKKDMIIIPRHILASSVIKVSFTKAHFNGSNYSF